MKKMLKAAAVLAAILMAFTLGACSDGDDGGSGSGGGGGGGGSKNPFGFTEEDYGYSFCLDKDGKVLQKVNSFDNGEDVEGAVFKVYYVTSGVMLVEYYGDYEDVTIPDGVTEIGALAFYGCTSLESVTIPASVTKISGFSGCTSLKSVTIPDSVTEIGINTFDGCTSLASVTIPDSVTKISAYVFSGCTSLKSVTFAATGGWKCIGSDSNADVTNANTNATNLTTGDGAWKSGLRRETE